MTLPKEANTKIGVNSIFEGIFKARGILLIEGNFKGDLIYSDQIYIANTASVESNIRGGSIFIEGAVKGNIFSDSRVVLLPGAKIFGDITTPELITQKGVVLKGVCNITQGNGRE